MLRIGSVTLMTPLLLAPIAGYCDLAFRLAVRSVRATPQTGIGDAPAVGLACTDLLCPQAVLSESEKSKWLAATCEEDRPLCMQLYGADADIMADAARWAQAHGATTIDINMGCPVDKVTKKNGGSKLLCDPCGTVALAHKVVRAVTVPVTAKIRLGWDDGSIITRTLPPALADAGIAAITVHGRTTAQMFRGQARLDTGGDDCIRAVVESLRAFPDVPVIGNGDVKAPADARRMMGLTGCAGVMIGRGALGQPWLFRDAAHHLATGTLPEPWPRADRARLVLMHFDNLLRMRDARIAINTIRSRMSWYSPHLQPWPGLKRDVQAIADAQAMRDYLLAGIERMQSSDAPILAAV
jgi:tRNA-dihydrouridine synthase B